MPDTLPKIIPPEPGDCVWCGEYVTSEREKAGATQPGDMAWASPDGDFGCDASPETTDDGVGDHARPYDLSRWLRATYLTVQLHVALKDVLEFCFSGERYETKNPYMVPALKKGRELAEEVEVCLSSSP